MRFSMIVLIAFPIAVFAIRPALGGPLEIAVEAYESGDYVRAFRLLRWDERADAKFLVGRMYHDGKGVEKDATWAKSSFEDAAERGHLQSQYELGMLLLEGRGIAVDQAEAVKWLRLAAEQGHKSAQKALSQIVTSPTIDFERIGATSIDEIIVRARESVWLMVEDADGHNLLARQISEGALYRLPTGSGYTVSTDDAGALEVYVEGALAGLMGPAGTGVMKLPVHRLTARRADDAQSPDDNATIGSLASRLAEGQSQMSAPGRQPIDQPASSNSYADRPVASDFSKHHESNSGVSTLLPTRRKSAVHAVPSRVLAIGDADDRFSISPSPPAPAGSTILVKRRGGPILPPTDSQTVDAAAAISQFEIIEAPKGSSRVDEQRVALVIGNSAYRNVARLRNTANDATDVGALLKRLGFDVTLVRDQDRVSLSEALLAFGDKAQGANIAAVFYAGHGIEVEGQNYLIPVDARLRTGRSVPLETLSLDHFLRAVEGAENLGLVILDACRENPFEPRMQMAGAFRSVARGLARVEPEGSSVLVAYAAKAGTIAADGDGRNSPYTSALLEHLDDPDIDIRIMFGRVRDAVMRATERQQQPFTSGSLGGEEMMLAPQQLASQ